MDNAFIAVIKPLYQSFYTRWANETKEMDASPANRNQYFMKYLKH